MGAHARLPRPLLQQIPPVLDHPRPPPRPRHRYQQLVAEARDTGQPIDTRDLEALLLADDEETTLVIGSWHYQGTGWTNPGDEALATAAAARARGYAAWKASKINSHI